MIYKMKQNLFAFGDDYIIRNANDEPVFFIDGKAFSFGDKLSFQDLAGNALAFISQKVFSFKKKYEIYRSGQLFAEITKNLTFFKDQYTVDVPGPNDYEVQGDFLDHEYSFFRNGIEVARVSKQYFTWSDTYGVEIIDGEDDITILATAVVIDQVKDDRRR